MMISRRFWMAFWLSYAGGYSRFHPAGRAEAWQAGSRPRNPSRRAFFISIGSAGFVAAAVSTSHNVAAAAAAEETSPNAEWFNKNLKPATEDRPAIPLPTISQEQQRELPALQGVIYGPSNSAATGANPRMTPFQLDPSIQSSASLLVEVILPATTTTTTKDEIVIQAARVPMQQVGSFPFEFQFNKLGNDGSRTTPADAALLEKEDLVVRASVELDFGKASCSYLRGQGVAKALTLPSKGSTTVPVNVRVPASVQMQFVPKSGKSSCSGALS